ncbi:hypothetical protein F5879DRAFT_942739 [Lentinula edodes]|uniref:Uncharacterized protein n=1 Tax=Lentinula edodes TaxID=5353 RepID=A0A1Q3EL66_LENED|nr:hypothetical protein F5879DRAFT_942739 [Lentinula edodes]KAJ3914927.1 hypothetical protein F5877DRAFT_70293 [Lentinula edodes]GAW07854.1 hypothetical protein LENED_009871 [Lentinula edodes]
MATGTPLLSLRSIFLLLLLVVFHVHVMGSPLLPRASEKSKPNRKLKLDSNRVVQITLTRTRQIESGVTGTIRQNRMVLNTEKDDFADEWKIYPGKRVGFGAVRDSAEVPFTSSNWPWRSHRFSELRKCKNDPTEVWEKLAEVPLKTWNPLNKTELFEHFENRIPVEGRFRYPDAIMQHLWQIKIIQDSDIQKWNQRVGEMLQMEMSEVYVKKMKEIKDEAEKRQKSRLAEEPSQNSLDTFGL